MSRKPLFPRFTAHEVFVQALFVVCALWGVAIVFVWTAPGDRDRFGRVKGTDFAHFYALADVARSGNAAELYDPVALHERQVRLAPASAGDFFSYSSYPPQTAAAFRPLSYFRYGAALAMWSIATALVYAVVVLGMWRRVKAWIPDGRLVFAAAFAFPPFWNLILHGQTTAWMLVAFGGAAWSWSRGARELGGAALGLLWMKPSFAPLATAVLLWRREWRALAGMVLSLALQAGVAIWVFGPDVWRRYVDVVMALDPRGIEPRPGQLHSIKALTDLVPDPIGVAIWVVACGVILVMLVRAWRDSVPIEVRLGLLAIGSVLASPHLTVYDATVLAPALLAIGGWLSAARPNAAGRYWQLCYWLFVAFLLPTANVIAVQASVPILAVVFWRASQETQNLTLKT